VADSYQARGIGSALARLLVADARAAGICEITALVRSENRAALALLRRVLGRLELRIEGPDLLVSASLPGCC
jgi:ribosomal protein S18 acetylase RimI-like enzyme